MENSCIFTYDYNRITVFGQELSVNGQTITPKTEYIKKVLDKIERGLFSKVLKMLMNSATAEQIQQYVNDEIRRVYILRKIRKAIKRCNETLTYTFKEITIAINKGTTKEYRSTARKKSSNTKRTSSGDSGDPDQPDPPSPPGLAYLFAYPRLISLSQRNRSLFSWRTAPVGGGKI